MTDTETAAPATKVMVPITKGKEIVEVNLDELPDEVYREVVLQGLKTIMNRGMTKVTIADLGSEEKVKAEAMIVANINLEKLYAGDIRITGGKSASKISGKVKTEAMRLARNIIKDEIKRSGGKISHYKASEITAAAKEYLDGDDGASLIETAKENLTAREKTAEKAATKVSAIAKSLKTDPELVKKANLAASKKKSGTLSAKQAGMTAKHKPSQANA